MPPSPRVVSPEEKPCCSRWLTSGIWPRWLKMVQPISRAWVPRKIRKMGSSTCTDSLTPRRLSAISRAMATNSAGSFQGVQTAGRKLKMASPLPAIETVIVST